MTATPPEPTWADIHAELNSIDRKLDDTLVTLFAHELDRTDHLADQARKDTK